MTVIRGGAKEHRGILMVDVGHFIEGPRWFDANVSPRQSSIDEHPVAGLHVTCNGMLVRERAHRRYSPQVGLDQAFIVAGNVVL